MKNMAMVDLIKEKAQSLIEEREGMGWELLRKDSAFTGSVYLYFERPAWEHKVRVRQIASWKKYGGEPMPEDAKLLRKEYRGRQHVATWYEYTVNEPAVWVIRISDHYESMVRASMEPSNESFIWDDMNGEWI